MVLYDSFLSPGHFGYSFIKFRVHTTQLSYFTFSFIELCSSSFSKMNSQIFVKVSQSLLCVRESQFVIQKQIQNWSSDARIWLKNVRGAREKQGGQRPWPCHHVWRPCATRPNQPSGPVWHMRPTHGLGWFGFFLLDKNAPLLFPFKSLHLPPFVFKKKKLKSCQIFSLQFSQLPNTITFSYEVGIE